MIKEEEQNIISNNQIDSNLPIKPNPNKALRKDLVNVYTNLFKIKIEPNTESGKVFLYSIKTIPELEANSPKLKKLIFNVQAKLKLEFKNAYRIIGLSLFSPIELKGLEIINSISVRKISDSSETHSSGKKSNNNNSSDSGTGSKSSDKEEYHLSIQPTQRFFDMSNFSDSNYAKNNSKEVLDMKMFLENILKSCLYSNENIVKFRDGQFFDRTASYHFQDKLKCK